MRQAAAGVSVPGNANQIGFPAPGSPTQANTALDQKVIMRTLLDRLVLLLFIATLPRVEVVDAVLLVPLEPMSGGAFGRTRRHAG
jgi:hypothetical protein